MHKLKSWLFWKLWESFTEDRQLVVARAVWWEHEQIIGRIKHRREFEEFVRLEAAKNV